MHDELDGRIVRALRAEADSLSVTVTPEQIEERVSRSAGLTWLPPALAALGLVAFVLVVSFGLASPKFAGIGEPPPVLELPVGTWVSNSAFRSGSICLAIEVADPMAESHSAWWWNPGGSDDCSSRTSSVVPAAAATDEVPLVRVEIALMPDQGNEVQFETISLRFTGYTDDGFELHGVPFRRVDDVDPLDWPIGGEGPAATSPVASPRNLREPCAVTQPDPPFVPPSPYPSVAPPLYESDWYGSEALWTMLDRDGEVWGVSAINLGEKTFWWSTDRRGMSDEPSPALTVVGTQLDGPSTFTAGSATNAARDDFAEAMLVGVEVPTAGCWQIEARYGDAVLSYVVWVKDE